MFLLVPAYPGCPKSEAVKRSLLLMGGGTFVRKVENGGVFGKRVDLSSMQGALCTVSVFFILHFTYLGVRTHPTHPPAYGPEHRQRKREASGVIAPPLFNTTSQSISKANFTKTSSHLTE